jgi:TolB-like protein
MIDNREPEAPDAAAVGVLTFINVSAEPKVDPLSDGITQDIVDAVTSVEGFEHEVRRCTLPQVGGDTHFCAMSYYLNVGWLLLGNVRENDGVLLTTAQLVCLDSGTPVWFGRGHCESAARRCTAEQMAAEMASRIADHLKARLCLGARQRLRARVPSRVLIPVPLHLP